MVNPAFRRGTASLAKDPNDAVRLAHHILLAVCGVSTSICRTSLMPATCCRHLRKIWITIMGHEIFLQAHFQGGSQNIPTSDVLACFSPFITASKDAWIHLEFTETDSCTIYFDTTSPSISHSMVSRPCGDKQLFRCIFLVSCPANNLQKSVFSGIRLPS
jgi:hypothetical protein